MHKWLYTGTVRKAVGGSWEVSEDGVEHGVCGRTYVASMTTATPRGFIASCTQRAICFVRRSCTWRRRLKVSAMRASFEMPKTSLFGMYAMAICERDGTARRKWAKSPGLGEIYRAKGGKLVCFERRTNLASEWDQMMFAKAGNVDVTNQDHFVMVLSKDSIIDHVCVGQNYLSAFEGGNGCTRERKKKRGGVCRGGIKNLPARRSS